MGLPGFTAEVSIYGATRAWVRLLTSGHGAGSIAPQQIGTGVDVDYWQNVAENMAVCPPPICGRDAYGVCHCKTSLISGEFGGPLNQHLPAG